MNNPYQSPFETGSPAAAHGRWWPAARGVIVTQLVCVAIAVALACLETQGIQLPSAFDFVTTALLLVANISLFLAPALMLYVLYQSTATITEQGTIILLEFVIVATNYLALFPLAQ